MFRLGIDIGASSCQFVLLDEQQRIVYHRSELHHNKVKDSVLNGLEDIRKKNRIISAELSVCGTMSHLLGVKKSFHTGEHLALHAGVQHIYPYAASCVEIGAQNTLYLEFCEGKEPLVKSNSNCASGTGSFFEEQAGRLDIKLEDISALVDQAHSIPYIAGRCSVFSKTDMIHHMQEGVPTADLLLGICYALVRNYKANILCNRPVKTPVVLCGGVMKNTGVLRAIRELLDLRDEDILLGEYLDSLPAIGCAVLANECVTLDELTETIRQSASTTVRSELPPLHLFRDVRDKKDFSTVPMEHGQAWLGVDIGSTSINLVLINEHKEILYYSYVKNLGKPLDTVRSEIEKMKKQLSTGVAIEKIAVTGSGRERIGQKIGASLIINEITAQTEGATLFHPETETIFEIGGQDSKYMSLKDGKMSDFEMNKVCAAGTGAFLEEQIKRLGITMQEFLDLAMKSDAPCALGDRCTVFIESSITKALADGNKLEDVCAGLAYAVANNYLNRVVNSKPIGDNVAIQGGIAYNEAVICAFRALTGKDIHVSPWFSVTGALGAASLCTNTQYLNFDKEKNRTLNRKLIEDTEKSFLGDYQAPEETANRPVIGIPRVIFLHKMFPLFRTMFTQLGFDVLLSPLSDREIVQLSQKYAIAETCYPIKLINGHIAWLLDRKVDYIFLPRLYTIRHKGSVARRDYSCLYMQTSPLLMEQTFRFSERGVKLLMPELSLQFGKKFMLNSLMSIAPQIGKKKAQMIPAITKGMSALFAHSDKLETLATDFLDTDEPVFVLVSRVYNIADPILNMGVEEELNRMGCRVIHLEHLEASTMHVETEYGNLCWPFGQHQLTGMEIIRQHKNLYPIYITNHGCGPDTALQHYIEKAMGDRAYLHLEVDEHSSRVGIITRLEAFLYSLNQANHAVRLPEREDEAEHENQGSVVLVPDFGIYTKLLLREIPADAVIQMTPPLTKHQSYNYAVNKEYYSLLIMLEELLRTVQSGQRYELLFPTDEGSEVFSQYGRLIQQELTRRGSPTTLTAPFIEDIPGRADYREFYARMLLLELGQIAGEDPVLEGNISELTARLRSLAAKARKVLADESRSTVLTIGEPLCVYKEGILSANIRTLRDTCRLIPMPLSEGLLFHWKDVDRAKKYERQLKELTWLHDQVQNDMDSAVFTSMDELFAAVCGMLDFCVGSLARYRLAKLLSASKTQMDGVLLIHSNEENAALIIKTIADAHRAEITVPVCTASLDFEHGLNGEEADAFIHYLEKA